MPEMREMDNPGPAEVTIGGVVYTIRSATPHEVFCATWGRESLKQTTPYLNDFLQKLVTLETALIGGGLLRNDLMPTPFAIGFLLIAILSLGLALLGLFPQGSSHSGQVEITDAAAVERFEFATIFRKKRWLAMSCVFLVGSVALAAAGVIIKHS